MATTQNLSQEEEDDAQNSGQGNTGSVPLDQEQFQIGGWWFRW